MRWSRSTGGQVVGSLSAIGEIVYVAEFTNQRTIGYMMRSGRKVFTYPKGTYTPIISDGQNLYLTGYSSITALAPIRPRPARLSNNFPAPKFHWPQHAHRQGISDALVAPSPVRALPGAAAAGAAHRAHRREMPVVKLVDEDLEAFRVVLDPVARGRAEVLVVDEHLRPRVRFHPGEEVGDEARVVARFHPPLGDRERLFRIAFVESGEGAPFGI